MQSGGAGSAYGVINLGNGDSQISNTQIVVTGTGESVGVWGSSPSVSKRMKVDGCRIEATTYTLVAGANTNVYVGASRLHGGPVVWFGGGLVTCANVYDELYVAFAGTCP